MTNLNKTCFWLYDGDSWEAFSNRMEAEECALAAIEKAREMCDPEWSDWVEDIAIYEAPEDSIDPDVDGKLLALAASVHIDPPKEWSEYVNEYEWVDYVMDYVES